jgi:tRNA G18 (ribose-2'-O)-methylase SpoU
MPDALLAGLAGDGDVLVLSGIANHDNIGGIFRNAAAFGVKAVLLDSDCCDPLYRKAIRVSVGAVLLVPFARLAPGEDPLALVERHGFAPLALSPAGTTLLSEIHPEPRQALLLGAEGPGLASELIDRARSVRIEMSGGFDSLNVATTSGIVLHHLSARRGRSWRV